MDAVLIFYLPVFVAGFLATLIFHQGVWFLLKLARILPATLPEAWTWGPPTKPLGVPRLMSMSFWGGLWAVVLAMVCLVFYGIQYWPWWAVTGALALTLVAIFVVPPIRREKIEFSFARLIIGCLLNGAWGAGTALLLNVMGVP